MFVPSLITWSTELSSCQVQSPTQPTLTEFNFPCQSAVEEDRWFVLITYKRLPAGPEQKLLHSQEHK